MNYNVQVNITTEHMAILSMIPLKYQNLVILITLEHPH